ncbi:MAG TPA: NIL domain-containing protein, partial [Clostridia bacterium]|nr:NIL domain-containing protein [Clostridia bacterium]
LFGIPSSEEGKEPAGTALRVVFAGEQVDDPIVSKLVLHLGIPVSILSADVRELNGAQYGQMLIRPPEEPEVYARAIRYLRDQGLTVEEVTRP